MADYLAIYLNDHLSGATVGLELARRIAGRDDAYAATVRGLVDDIEQDRRTLEETMDRLGAGRDRVKVAAGWVGEKLGRLKRNGHLLSLSPLSRLEEIEVLALGVEGKGAMWRALRVALAGDARVDAVELDRLIARADAQREALEELRLLAVAETLAA